MGKAIRGVRGSIPTLLAGAAMIAVVILAVLALFGDGGDELLAVGPRECNGHVELCDRRVDEVAFAATHNSMSAADEGFFIPAHTDGIPEQLDSGIRGLLIDIWRGAELEDGTVTTDLGSANRDAVAEELGEDTIAAVERLIGRPLAFEGLETDVDAQLYLCHIFCEFGATALAPALEGIKSWLEANPEEVLIVFVQDETEPTLIEEAFEDSGLAELAWQERLTPDSKFPTLGEMVRRDERLIVMAEKQATDAPWYQDGFQITQDTEFRHTSPDDMSCAFNRGLPESPLFLVNHWIATDVPDPSNAAIVNEFDFLLDRARRCEEERELTTSLLAVDFHEIGDVRSVVDALNGVSTR